VNGYFHDPTGANAQAVKARYQGVCRGCGAYTQSRNGKGDAYAYRKRAFHTRSRPVFVRHYRELVPMAPGGPTRAPAACGRHWPAPAAPADAIIDAELQRALADPDRLRGIAELAARWAAAFLRDPAGVIRTKALGSERIERKLLDALPGGDDALSAARWEFLGPMLSPALIALNRDAFVIGARGDDRRPRRPSRGV
jgi:hypothetical protein